MKTEFDVIVIGAGPAGLSAAAKVAEAGHTCALIDRMGPGGQLMNLGEVRGCPGLAAGTTGPDLIGQLLDPALGAGAELIVDEVTDIEGDDDGPWTVQGLDGSYRARALILATGLGAGTTGFPREQDFEGRGLSHCASCDGPLYAGRPVIVDGDGAWAAQEAIDLAGMVAHVTLVADGRTGALTDRRLADLARLPNVTVVDGRITAIEGEGCIERVAVATGSEMRVLPAAAVFALARRAPAASFAAGMASLADTGHALTDAASTAGHPSLFACGDVRKGASESISEAIADGARAGQYAARWIASCD